MRGGEKNALDDEKVTIDFAFASVCSIKSIKKGDLFSTENIWVKRPGTGDFLAKDYENILGKRAARDISADRQININDIQ